MEGVGNPETTVPPGISLPEQLNSIRAALRCSAGQRSNRRDSYAALKHLSEQMNKFKCYTRPPTHFNFFEAVVVAYEKRVRSPTRSM